MARILIVEPDPSRQASLRSRVQDEGHMAVSVSSANLAIAEAREARPDLVLLAEDLGESTDGYEVARRLTPTCEAQRSPVLLCSDLPTTAEHIERALAAGCDRFLGKTEMGALGSILQRTLAGKAREDDLDERRRALDDENRRLRQARALEASEQGSSIEGSGSSDSTAGGADRSAPDGVMVVDGTCVVRHADRWVKDLLGVDAEGVALAGLFPTSGLEGFVRDTRTERRFGFRFDFAGHPGGPSTSLMASVSPLATTVDGAVESASLRVVSLFDVSRLARCPTAASALLHNQLAALIENARESYGPESWIGQSPATCELRTTLLGLIESKSSPVLIQGPAGAGKELLARILHYTGGSSGPFLQLCCSAFSPENLERELFGSETQGGRPGLCSLASAGTLYLEAVEDLPLDTQARLLEAIGASEVSGDSRTAHSTDVRWVASTNTDLSQRVERGQFLESLYDKLRVNELVTAPLHLRPADLAELTHHYLARYGSVRGVVAISTEALGALRRYEWPGNVDELADCIEQACLNASGDQIEFEDLPGPLRGLGAGPGWVPSSVGVLAAGSRAGIGQPMGSAMPRAAGWEPNAWEITDRDPISLDHYQRKVLLRALASCDGDKMAAARLLNVGKSTFYRKLKRFGIN